MAEDKQINELDERKMRLKRLEDIKNSGINPYPEKFDKQQSLAEAKISKEGTKIKTAGRILTIRAMGKIAFCHLMDDSGRMQIVLNTNEISEDKFNWFVNTFDMGDFIGVEGEIFTTKKGEISILVKDYKFLGKALQPLPEKFHGLKDEELIYRERYLDLISNESSMQRFKLRSEIIKALREFYWSRGFTEIETPVLCNNASGATAKPFITHHNAMDTDVYLRIAPEIYLKEAIIGGFDKVFEMARCFRNEGMDPSHLQDFTMVEHYAAYWNYEDNMKFTEEMICHILQKFFGGYKIEIMNRAGELKEVDFTPPWPRHTMMDLIKNDCGIDFEDYKDAETLRKEIKKKKIELENIDNLGRGSLIDGLYKAVSRDKLISPTFLIQHPLDLSPLARRNDDNGDIVDRFQLVVNTWEICNAYSELVDPIDQANRFEKQSEAKEAGDEEAHGKDDEFVQALEHGAPPISGYGMGIDRLVALLTQQPNLRDVVLFPLLKPAGENVKKIKETKIATVVLNKEIKLETWQEMNTVAHLNASFASRKGKELLYTDSAETKDGEKLLLNIQHAIMIKEAQKSKEILDLIEKAKSDGLDVYEFTQEMQSTTNDKKVLAETKEKKLKDIKILGILIFGDKSKVDELTDNFKLAK